MIKIIINEVNNNIRIHMVLLVAVVVNCLGSSISVKLNNVDLLFW